MRADGRSIAALIAVQTLFGLHYLAAKIVVAAIPPEPWALIRAGGAAILLLALLAVLRTAVPREPRLLLELAGLGLLGVALNQYLFVAGLARTTPGHSALINTSMPVLVAIIAVLLGREKPTLARFLGIGTTLAGVLVLIGPEQITWGSETLTGDLVTLANAVSYSLFLVLGKPVLERIPTLPATALLLGFGSLWLLPIGAPGLLALDPRTIDHRTALIGAFIILGPTIGAYLLNTYALRRVDSSIVAFFIYLQPVIGAGLSIALGFERPTYRLFIAAATLFLGVFIALRAPIPRTSPTPLGPET